MFQRIIQNALAKLQHGYLTLVDGDHQHSYGDPSAGLKATLKIHSPNFYRRVALGGGLGAAESLMDGEWSCTDLTSLVRILIRNDELANGMETGWAWWRQKMAVFGNWLRRNTPTNARKNIREHYDLGNDFFRLFLDDTLCYSSGIFERDDTTLPEASVEKMDRACRKLELSSRDHLLEIGTGWGGLATHAAHHYGCRVTTTTISAEQRKFASERVRQKGLEQRVSILADDYRELRGHFDKLVSIEMIEAVGHQYFDTYLGQCSRLLRPDGMMVMQAIVIQDQHFAVHKRSVDFIGKYIFPGGCLPSVAAICDSVSRATDFRLIHLEELSGHYVRTLQAWRERFWQNIEAVRKLGFDERFIRMWNYYFCYCEATFLERRVNVVQMTLAKPACRSEANHWLSRPPVTDWIECHGDPDFKGDARSRSNGHDTSARRKEVNA